MGRPKNAWERTVQRKLEECGKYWMETKRKAGDKEEWRFLLERIQRQDYTQEKLLQCYYNESLLNST